MMKTHNKLILFLVLLLILVGAYFLSKDSKESTNSEDVVHFSCTKGTFDAYFDHESVKIKLSDGRSLDLPQVRSGSGIRYEKDKIAFIGKGNDSLIQENGITTYENCVADSSNNNTQVNGRSVFTDQGKTISFSYPNDLSVSGGGLGYTESWRTNTQSLGIILAKVILPKEIEPSTNFSEAVFSVGTSSDPNEIKNCLIPRNGEVEKDEVKINGLTYKKITLTDAGAGNYYDTVSYRTIQNDQCYAVEYTIHSTNIGNYSPDQNIKEFDTQKIVSILESMAQSVNFLKTEISDNNNKEVVVTPLEVVEDSRCPKEVACIWAGTVKVKVRVVNKSGQSESGILTLNESKVISGVSVTLTNVLPEKTSKNIPFSDYKFSFSIK